MTREELHGDVRLDPAWPSILFERDEDADRSVNPARPTHFEDLHLDQVIGTIVASRPEHHLEPFFETPLRYTAGITYRQAVFRDCENPVVRQALDTWSAHMRAVRGRLEDVRALPYRYEQDAWFLDAVSLYGEAVTALRAALDGAPIRSDGLVGFARALGRYADSSRFRLLREEAQTVRAALATIRYSLTIKGLKLTVRPFEDRPDYTAVVAATFSKFRQEDQNSYLVRFADARTMNRVEAEVVALVAKLFPDVFGRLTAFSDRHRDFLDPGVTRFDREIQFYLAYLDYRDRIRHGGLPFCYPELVAGESRVDVRRTFDLALAEKRMSETADPAPVVPNDFRLTPLEQIAIITGPNQGGKTTLARAIGQVFYLASLGCPVPGESAVIPAIDGVFTHFERAESAGSGRGQLKDDLIRLRSILDHATASSVVILNEVFTSTTFDDALYLSSEMLMRLQGLGALVVLVTFLVELQAGDPKRASFVALVDPHDPTRRTYRIIRNPGDGLSYAATLAERHRLTYPQLRERLTP